MSDAPPREQRGLLRGLLAVAALGVVAILLPFYGTLLWALIIAPLFAPMQRSCNGGWAGGLRWPRC